MSEPAGERSASRPGARRRIGLLCLSAIPDDPRVRRQGDLMTDAGWDVVAIGLPGHRSPDPAWTCLAVEQSVIGPAPGSIQWKGRAALRILRMSVDRAFVEQAFWTANPRFEQIYQLARREKVDLWLANDWTTLPIAARLAAEQGVPYGYDTHEFAVDEHAQRLLWRIVHRPLIKAAEAGSIRSAAFVTCVSDGIADRLQSIYGLAKRPVVIRNTPHYQAHPLRPIGETIRVLYHGIVAPGRGLEATIRSVPLWRPEFHLTIRGPVHGEYKASLEALAQQAGVADRVALDPPVPMTELVARAAEFDVGLFTLPDHSEQNVYVLPNKFFEYAMAGLALCVSDLPEMARLLREHDLGELISSCEPEPIAESVNRLDRESIHRFKANALEAAKSLNWQAEGRQFAELGSAATMAASRGSRGDA